MKGIQHSYDIIPEDITPALALDLLKKGNFRFINNLKINRDLLEQVNETKDGQWPFAAILSCMDSRTSAELIFDLGLGDIFSIRIAGNIITDGILGSLEYATAIAKSKLIVVLAHTNCGAIKGACDEVEFGHFSAIKSMIQPAINIAKKTTHNHDANDKAFLTNVAENNAKYGIGQIMERSPMIKKLIDEGELGIIPALYDVSTGNVIFFDNEAIFNNKAETVTAKQ